MILSTEKLFNHHIYSTLTQKALECDNIGALNIFILKDIENLKRLAAKHSIKDNQQCTETIVFLKVLELFSSPDPKEEIKVIAFKIFNKKHDHLDENIIGNWTVRNIRYVDLHLLK